MATLSSLTVSDTGSTLLPQGTVAERPGYSVQVFTATGAATFSVPTGITAVDVLVVGAGGAGGAIGGGGGGGGVVYYPNYPVTPGGTVPLTVGVGGAPGGTYPAPASGSGGNSTFGPLTALGGGGAGSWNSVTPNPGGSGAGGPGTPGTGTAGGTAGQPAQPNPGSSINVGYPGAAGASNPSADATTGAGTYTAGGGGGAGQAGGHPSKTAPGNTSGDRTAGRKGGDGVAVSISGYSQYYGGGGGGASHYTPIGYASPVALAMGGAGGGGKGGSYDFHYDALFPGGFPGTGGVTGGPGSNGSGPASLQLNTGLNVIAPTSGMPVPSSQGGYGAGEPGMRNTGGGGGGGSYYTTHTSEGGRGGPGVVVVRYANPNTDAPTTGMMRYNTEGGYMEVYNGTIWTPVKKTVVSFVQTGTTNWKVPIGIQAVDILVVGGGGSGGALGGGGGAGGHLYVTNVPVQPGGTIPVSVGVGGFGVYAFPPHYNVRKGAPSRFGGYEAYGGGAGGNHPSNNNNFTSYPSNHPLWGYGGPASPGASGGGATHSHPGQYGLGIFGQGYPGGDAPNPSPHSQAGGGGAGGAGSPAPRGTPDNRGGAGGVGVSNSITGSAVYRAGGGGGGAHGGTLGGDGGNGGGGQGGKDNASGGAYQAFSYQKYTGTPTASPALPLSSPGQDNTGGGGGGSGHNSGNPYGFGGNGGPGIVIVRY